MGNACLADGALASGLNMVPGAIGGMGKLRGDRLGQHSIRINDPFRLCFHWSESGPQEVEIVDDH